MTEEAVLIGLDLGFEDVVRLGRTDGTFKGKLRVPLLEFAKRQTRFLNIRSNREMSRSVLIFLCVANCQF